MGVDVRVQQAAGDLMDTVLVTLPNLDSISLSQTLLPAQRVARVRLHRRGRPAGAGSSTAQRAALRAGGGLQRQHLTVDGQIAATHDRLKHPVVDVAAVKA